MFRAFYQKMDADRAIGEIFAVIVALLINLQHDNNVDKKRSADVYFCVKVAIL